MQKITCIHPDFNGEAKNKLSLCIQMSSNAITYGLVDQETSTLVKLVDCLHVEEIQKQLKTLIEEDLVSHSIEEVKIIYQAEKQVNIPFELFNKDVFNESWTLLKLGENFKVHQNKQEQLQYFQLFSVPEALQAIIDEYYPQAVWYSNDFVQMNQFLDQSESFISLDFKAGQFHFLYVDQNQVQLQRVFDIENSHELAYFLQVCIQSVNINKHNTKVFISGLINENDENFRVIQNAFDKLEFNIPMGKAHQLEVLEDYPIHYYTTLTNFAVCE